MIVEVTFSSKQYVRAKTHQGGLRKAKRQLKDLLGNNLYKLLITHVEVRTIPEEEFYSKD